MGPTNPSSTKQAVDFTDNNVDENVPCGKCQEIECTMTIGSQGRKKVCSTKWIRCDGCLAWYHGMCAELQISDINSIKKLEKHGVRWYCEACVKEPPSSDDGNVTVGMSTQHKATILKLDGIENAIKGMQKTYSDALKSNAELVSKLKEDYESVVVASVKQIKKATETNENTEKIIRRQQQIQETEQRKLNAILYGIKETEYPILDQVNQFMKQECFKHSNQPVMAIRLGRKQTDQNSPGSRPRPIKITFESEPHKWDFVKRINSGNMRRDGIFCKIDVSQEVRNQEWALREKVRELRKSEDGVDYRIRNAHIEQREPSGEWKALKPERNSQVTNV